MSKPQDARRVQKLWPENVYQKTYGRHPPQQKTTSFSSTSDAHGTSENMTNYWSVSSVKTNHYSVLSSLREDPPFFAQSQSTHRSVSGTKAMPAAMRESSILLPPTDEPEVPKIDKMDIPSDES